MERFWGGAIMSIIVDGFSIGSFEPPVGRCDHGVPEWDYCPVCDSPPEAEEEDFGEPCCVCGDPACHSL
jgi:hypothetical protein